MERMGDHERMLPKGKITVIENVIRNQIMLKKRKEKNTTLFGRKSGINSVI